MPLPRARSLPSPPWLALALLLLFAGCRDRPEIAATPATAADARVGLDEHHRFIVTGLPANHGWLRGARVAVLDEGAGHRALMMVTEVRGATVGLSVLVERPTTKVAGQRVAVLAKGERPLLGKFHATLLAREGPRLRLSRGAADGVAAGDRYVVVDEGGQVVGRVEVVEAQDAVSWALPLDGGGRMAVGHEARWQPAVAPGSFGERLRVLVVSFGPVDKGSAEDEREGRRYAGKLADALADAAHGWGRRDSAAGEVGGLEVVPLVDERVTAIGDAAGHEQAREIGRRHRADLVVWGSAQCSPTSCVLPRFTVVEPEGLYAAERDGAELPVDHARMKLSAAELPPDPMALAAALLGDLAWRAQRYPDAVYYLDRALGGAAYRGEDDLVARWRLARAANHADQRTRARAEAAALAADAEARGALGWALSAELELVDLDASEGELAAAQTRAERVLTRARAGGDAHREAYALSSLGDLAGRRGEPETALTHLRAAAALAKRLGWQGQYAVTMSNVADILQARGELDEALRIFRDEVAPAFKLPGDVRLRAVTMGKVADILETHGELDEALRIRREEELPVYERHGDMWLRAMTMGKVADILAVRGALDEALRIHREEVLPVRERLGDVRGRAVTMGKVADILEARGELDEALRIRREELLPVFERLGDVQQRAVTMGKVADILEARGDLDEALRIQREELLPVFERLGDVRERAMTMGKVADILAVRGELDEALRIHRAEVLPVFERLGDAHVLLVGRANVALYLLRRGQPGDRDEARALLAAAHAAAVLMRLPEAGQIEGIQRAEGFAPTAWAGIGAGLEAVPEGVRVTHVVAGGPAAGALAVGDVLVAVDGVSLAGSTVAAATERIRGAEGSAVRLDVRRGGAGAVEAVTLVRRRLTFGGEGGR